MRLVYGALTAAIFLPAAVVADLPVHCLRHQVQGEWTFVLSAPSSQRSSCGHGHPDKEDAQPPRSLVDEKKGSAVERFVLHDPNVATRADRKGERGTWTMIYDEGFEVNVGDRSFFAFSNFTFEQDSVTHEKKNVSHCGQTMVGWYQNTKRTEFGCYYGYKMDPQTTKNVAAAPSESEHTTHEDKKIDHATLSHTVSNLNKKLSMLQVGWKARVMPKWIGKTVSEMNAYAGIKRSTSMRELRMDRLQQNQHSKRRVRSFLQRPVQPPAEWDWSNLTNGINYLEPVMDQSDCGSCYAASSMRMLTARHKIATKSPDALPWSISMPLFCGEYNQGCKGGFPFLMAKWSSELGLLPATCMRYSTAGKCKLECDLSKLSGKRYKAANHRYLGSFYGNSSTSEIMQELYEKGPLVLSFEPQEDFMYYSDGIYKSTADDSHAKQNKPRGEWERVDHAVLLVGYGVENGTKYWKLQNSWGEDWGEDGYFRMLRGADESGIESSAEAADVVEDEQNGRQIDEFFRAQSVASM
eukprot:TRINITY_DN21321_c0_g1_i2.p1 TRINITY_DN21321_c0_g1~~TRINITY_DN21321_c0_g1_i2.p1  ORF type:complete len:554 (-),score=125.19 TRINITY_DN21321_c0_g1_i2:55-1626(-)